MTLSADFLIATGWHEYAEHVLPANAPDIQTQETRRAYYGGVNALMGILKRVGEPDISEDESEAILTRIEADLKQFKDDVLAGRR
jgi:hypothetical protein